MSGEKYRPALAYAVAVASVGLALYLTLFLQPFIQPSVFPLFFAAVMISAWYGGFGPGIVATVLSDVSIDAFLIEPPGLLNIDLNDFLRLTVFTLVTGLTSSLTARRKRAEEALRREQRQLEVRVQERTAELTQTNEVLRAEIFKRQETEKSLRESEEKFRRLAENIQEVFWLCDPEIREIYYVSPAYEKIWGRTCQSLYDSPQSFLEAIVAEDRDSVVDTIRREIRNGYDVNFRIVRPDGVVRWIRDRAFPIRDGTGEVYWIAGIAEDMTEMMQSQEVLKRHAQIIDQIHDSVVSTDLDGYITSWNKGAERLFGYSVDETLNKHISFVYPEEGKGFLQQEVIAPLRAKGTHDVEVRMQRKSGERFYAHLGLSLLKDGKGSALGMIGYSMDVTARKKAEEEKQQLLSRLTQRVKELTVLHRTARLLERENKEIGDSLQDVVGVLPSGWQYPEITGARILIDGSEFKTPNFRASPWCQREDFTTAGGQQGAVEIVYLDERPRENEGPFLAEERSLIASLVELLKLYLERKEAWIRAAQFAQDLEERNKELLRLQGEMGRVERLAALGQITGSIAHDLGTPLNSVLDYTQILRREELPESTQRRLNIIQMQVERMVEIINQYLSRTRSSFQKREGVNANKLIEETLDLLSPKFHQQRVQVSTNLSSSLPLIRGDVISLQRVLINLLDNAIDATGPGGCITITTDPTAPSETTPAGVSVVITDTGRGIPADLLPKIFDFFVTTKAPGKGTGMGLAVCQEIAKQHGGAINITSEEGRGTSVRLVLPAGEAGGCDALVSAD